MRFSIILVVIILVTSVTISYSKYIKRWSTSLGTIIEVECIEGYKFALSQIKDYQNKPIRCNDK